VHGKNKGKGSSLDEGKDNEPKDAFIEKMIRIPIKLSWENYSISRK